MTIKQHSTRPGTEFTSDDFGADFIWGVATAAYQIEGAANEEGRSDCIWDVFARKKGKIKNGDDARETCDFYHRYEEDLAIAQSLGFRAFRFSVSWSRIIPDGRGKVNQQGIDFYNRLITKCLSLNMVPWITLYHWDLPQALEVARGWKNRKVVDWFGDYTRVCAEAFGDRVKCWIVLNEPLATAGLGYTTGLHAPGKKGIWNFLPVVHHLALSQAEGARVLRKHVPRAYIGTAFSCSYVHPYSDSPADVRAAKRADALMNRLFVEPALGLGYPRDAFPFLGYLDHYKLPGDDQKLRFDFDFVGIQNYFSVVVRHSYLAPVVWLKEVSASSRSMPVTKMGWEINADGMFKIIRQFANYKGIRDLIVSENGAAFEDVLENGQVTDAERVEFFKDYLSAILQAKNEGAKVKGFFAWTLMDNFEWAEGYAARFGLVYVNFKNQQRVVKSSGKWFAQFLREKAI